MIGAPVPTDPLSYTPAIVPWEGRASLASLRPQLPAGQPA